MSPNLRGIPSYDQQHEQHAEPEQPFADNAMTLAWQNAEDRETGAEAVIELQARRRQKLEEAKKKRGRLRFLGL